MSSLTIWTNKNGKQYYTTRINNKNYQLHRILWVYHYGFIPKDKQIDHIDHNGLNNRLSNLRIVTHQENGKNVKMHKDNTSGVMGVYWHKQVNKWMAYIRINGKLIYLGLFVDKGEAIAARKEAEVKYGFHSNHGRENYEA